MVMCTETLDTAVLEVVGQTWRSRVLSDRAVGVRPPVPPDQRDRRQRARFLLPWPRSALPLPMVPSYGSSDGRDRGAGGGHEGRETCLRLLQFTFRSVAQSAGRLAHPDDAD